MPVGKSDPEATEFAKLSGEFLVVEEKVDGSGVSLFFDDQLILQVYHRGSPAIGKEFIQLRMWAATYQDTLFDLLGDRYILFGEWMYNKHTIYYDSLPSFFLESDMYDKQEEIWLSTEARMRLLAAHNYIFSVPIRDMIRPVKLSQITSLIGKPRYQSEKWPENLWKTCERLDIPLNRVLDQTEKASLMEGLYIKHEDAKHVIGRFKYVRYEFVDLIIQSNSHIRDREIVPNKLLGG
jgi:hypothetical protein